MWRFPWVHLLGKRWGMQFCRMVVNRLARENKWEKEDFELGTSCMRTANVSTPFLALYTVSDYYRSNRHGHGCSPLPVMNQLLCVLCLYFLICRLRWFSVLLYPRLAAFLASLHLPYLYAFVAQIQCHVSIFKIEVTRQAPVQAAR